MGLEELNSNVVLPPLIRPLIPAPLPSATFFFARSWAFTGLFLASPNLFPQPENKNMRLKNPHIMIFFELNIYFIKKLTPKYLYY